MKCMICKILGTFLTEANDPPTFEHLTLINVFNVFRNNIEKCVVKTEICKLLLRDCEGHLN